MSMRVKVERELETEKEEKEAAEVTDKAKLGAKARSCK